MKFYKLKTYVPNAFHIKSHLQVAAKYIKVNQSNVIQRLIKMKVSKSINVSVKIFLTCDWELEWDRVFQLFCLLSTSTINGDCEIWTSQSHSHMFISHYNTSLLCDIFKTCNLFFFSLFVFPYTNISYIFISLCFKTKVKKAIFTYITKPPSQIYHIYKISLQLWKIVNGRMEKRITCFIRSIKKVFQLFYWNSHWEESKNDFKLTEIRRRSSLTWLLGIHQFRFKGCYAVIEDEILPRFELRLFWIFPLKWLEMASPTW